MSEAEVAAEATPTDFILINGGPCIPLCLPKCDGCGKDRAEIYAPAPHRVAGEFARNDFSLGGCFNPAMNDKQRNALACKCPKDGDTAWLLRVPPKHLLSRYFWEVETEQTVFAPTVCHMPNNMAGLNFDIVALKFDCDGNCTGEVEMPDGLAGIDGGVDGCGHGCSPECEYMTGPDEWVEIGIKFNSVPTKADLTRMSGKICLVADVRGFDMPQHT